MSNYIAIVHKDAKSDFSVSFPDFPGCITAGKDIDEAKDMAQEALTFHVQGMIEDGETLPDPSKLEEIMNDPDYPEVNRRAAYALIATPQ
ncbi:toxin-antitoxin system, antitoxin component, HicB family [delta proteobacterium NaphS2]|nr:toxin-antitoxin system, antitoxin component, HicB family [delta proteobacterium NaphS2]